MKMPHWPIYTGTNKDIYSTIPRMKRILKLLGNPHKQLKNIFHITGTKGKGSTAHFISNILMESGYSVNTYTSPHIYNCNERLLFNGQQITDDELYELTEQVRFVCERENIEPSLFESMTACMFLAFSKHQADANVIEVGMGAKYDATNVFDENPPIACIFTPIHLDHVKFLGNKIESVAENKSYLLKKGVKNVVLSSQSKEAKQVLVQKSKELGISNIFCYGEDYEVFKNEETGKPVFESSKLDECFEFENPTLEGDYQLVNASCAITSCLANFDIFKNINIDAISRGIHKTHNIVRLQKIESGRLFEKLPSGSVFYIDGAHNQLASHALAQFITEFKQQHRDYKVCISIARTKGANNEVFIKEFEINNQKIVDLIVCNRANLESIPEPPETIARACKNLGFNFKIAHTIEETIDEVANFAQGQKVLFIATGSLYIARDVMQSNKL